MAIQVLACPKCGAPLPPSASAVVRCPYCGVSLVGVPFAGYVVDGPPPRPLAEAAWDDAHAPRFVVGGRTFVRLGRLARGRLADLFLARTDRTLTQLVVVKIPRSTSDGDHLAREYARLGSLETADVRGAAHFARLVPQRVLHGAFESPDGSKRVATVFRYRSGFVQTLEDVRAAYPSGVDPRHVIWIGRRLYELLGFVHEAGMVHGAIFPWHLLVHPRDHGLALAGTSRLAFVGHADPPAFDDAERPFVPEARAHGAPASPGADVAMAARALVALLGGDPATCVIPSSVPDPIVEVLRDACDAERDGVRSPAWSYVERLGDAGRAAFGPPTFVPFTLPGWTGHP